MGSRGGPLAPPLQTEQRGRRPQGQQVLLSQADEHSGEGETLKDLRGRQPRPELSSSLPDGPWGCRVGGMHHSGARWGPEAYRDEGGGDRGLDRGHDT